MTFMGKTLLLLGLFFVAGRILLLIGRKFAIPLGHLSGDITVTGKRFVFYSPLSTMLLVSLVASAVLTLFI